MNQFELVAPGIAQIGGDDLRAFGDVAVAEIGFEGDPAADWTVAGLARMAGLSRTGFAERFSVRLGVTSMGYLTAWRMQIAREAIGTRGLSVAEAADVAGYASESVFSRGFKQEIGVSPATFRHAARETATEQAA